MTKFLILLVVILLIFISGCINPAPGCQKQIGFGGCFGKTIIKNLKVKPPIECLEIRANNCNGGVLEVNNFCNKSVSIDGLEIDPNSGYIYLGVKRENDGYSMVYLSDNSTVYIPEKDEKIEINGSFQGRNFIITFTKTKNLC